MAARKGGELESLLGPARAAMLTALDRPSSIGELAKELRYAPSTFTHHADRLESSGLVTIEQIGRHVILDRTDAGRLLVELLTR